MLKWKLQIATTWQRKHVDEEWWDLFDVAMGAYDGVEVCEFIGNFFYRKKLIKFVIKVILDYIGMTVC